MSAWELPESVDVGGEEVPIRSDFRAALDVLAVLGDPDLDDSERGRIAFEVFYPEAGSIAQADVDEAASRMRWFLNGGEEPDGRPRPRLVDWGQDFPIIVNPVNRVLGFECREAGHLHWWTFLSAYAEIGDCLFAQVVALRKKLRGGGKLSKQDKRFYRENRKLVDFKAPDAPSDAELGDWV